MYNLYNNVFNNFFTFNIQKNATKNNKIVYFCGINYINNKIRLFGAEKCGIKIAKLLINDYDIIVFQGCDSQYRIKNLNANVVNGIDVKFDRRYIKNMINKINSISPFCIVCNIANGIQYLFWSMIAKSLDIKFIALLHNNEIYMKLSLIELYKILNVNKNIILDNIDELYNTIMINSSKIGYQLNRYVDNKYVEKSFIFSNIIEQNYINDIENNVIIYVGRINKNIKRTNLLLEAIKNTNYMLYVIGDVCDYDGIINIHEYADSDNIIFIDYTDNIEKYYDIAKILVIPSIHESLPNVILESFSYGIPVVGFEECDAINYLIEDYVNGFKIKNSTSKSLLNKINEIFDIDNETFMKIKNNAYSSCFNYGKDKTLNVLKIILEEVKRG